MHQRPVNLRLSRRLSAKAREQINSVVERLPQLIGNPIAVTALPRLSAYRGRLVSGVSGGRGTPVHAASFIRDRRIVLETQLLERPKTLRLITVHEIFHFVWAHFGNSRRRAFAAVIQAEVSHGARGDLGESSSRQKALLPDSWRDYVCESFCDTAAWMYAGVDRYREFTLAVRWRKQRQNFFERTFGVGVRGC